LLNYREIERLRAAKYAGFNKPSDVQAWIDEMMQAAGFLQALDPEFAKWQRKAQKSIRESELPADMKMDDTGFTLAQERERTLRAMVKRACARLHGIRDG
jgi:hypothetical protein